MNGKLIVIEGACDGIGKSTQFKLLIDRLKKEGKVVINHHFPSYGTKQAEDVEKYLRGDYGGPKDLSPYKVHEFYAHDRDVTWHTLLEEKYNEGSIILLDRYTTSSIIYQSSTIEDLDEKKKFIDHVINYEYNKLQIKEPDLVIFLCAPFNLVQKLRSKRQDNEGIINDILESDNEYMKNVYENAIFVADYLNWEHVECSKDNEMRSINDISDEVYTLVKRKITKNILK